MESFLPLKTHAENGGRDGEDVVLLGKRLVWDGEQVFGLHCEDRRQHVYVVGKSGAGKTSLLRNALIQDIHCGRGVGLIDPHGDLAADLLDHIPPGRTDDVIYFAPADLEHPVSFNLLASHDPDSRARVASGVVAAFRSIWKDSWGPRVEWILYATIATLLECRNTSLLGVQRMLVDDTYREWVLRQVRDDAIRSFWLDEFARYDTRFLREAIAPIQNKVGQLMAAPALRLVLGQVRNRIDVASVMDTGKIFIANLSKGLLGEDKSSLIGALLVTQFHNAAMARAARPPDERPDFHLVVDEFQSFSSTDTFASILSEARKYHLCLTLAHQYIGQLSEEVASAVFGNVGTLIAFRVGESDARVLTREFGGHFDPGLFSDLDNWRVCVKLLNRGRYGDAFLGTTLPPLNTFYGRGENLIRQSRARYAAPRRVVEDKIRRWLRGTELY